MSIQDNIRTQAPSAKTSRYGDEIERACNEHRAEFGLPPIAEGDKRRCLTEKCRDGCPFDPGDVL
jgi:hypothetical protein